MSEKHPLPVAGIFVKVNVSMALEINSSKAIPKRCFCISDVLYFYLESLLL